MIDLHCHVLPGVDDGPATPEVAIELVRAAQADGITAIAATPHIDGLHRPLSSGQIRAAVRALQTRLHAARVEVQITTGAELALTRAVALDDAELAALSLGRGGWLLLECPLSHTATPGFTTAARVLARRGHQLLLAHPERCPLFVRSPHELEDLLDEGMLAQVTARALNGGFGRTARDLARYLVDRGMAHVVASDGHGPGRPAKLAAPLARTSLAPSLIDWLTREVPAALLAGAELPPRPRGIDTEPARRRRLARLVGR